jgi:transposase-like protein
MTRKQDSVKPQGCIDFTKRSRRNVDTLRPLVAEALQQILEGEMEEAVGAGKWERTGARLGYRSG